jgi:hypothetical protein
MGLANAIGIGISFSRGGQNWESYWANLISATVENAAPRNIIMTFANSDTSLLATDFSVNGFYVYSISRDVTNKIITLTLNTYVVYGDVLTLTFTKTGGTADVTNNVAIESEITTYITGLVTPLSASKIISLNNSVRVFKKGLFAAALLDVFDVLYIIDGETKESSYKNLIKDAHHITATIDPTWAASGVTGNGTDQFLNTNYKPKSQGSTFTVNSASLFVFSKTDTSVAAVSIGARSALNTNRAFITCKDGIVSSWYLNTNITTGGTINVADSLGMFVASRVAANLTVAYKNFVAIGSFNHAASDCPDFELFILSLNNAGTAATFDTKKVSFIAAGRGFTKEEVIAINNGIVVSGLMVNLMLTAGLRGKEHYIMPVLVKHG